MIKIYLVSFISGLIFALGLGLSGMVLPEKVLGFLDVFENWGNWDPSLIFVMLGAMLIHMISYYWIKKIKKMPYPILSQEWHLPTKKEITPSLLVGSVLFGIGWGLVGLCPGPALVSLSKGQVEIFIFVANMIFGMILFRLLNKIFNFKR